MASPLIEAMRASGDIVEFGSYREDVEYLDFLIESIELGEKWHILRTEDGSFQRRSFAGLFAKLKETARALLRKYRYNGRRLTSDQNESGFFHSSNLKDLEVDLLNKKNRLSSLPDFGTLRGKILDELVVRGKDGNPLSLLQKISEVVYLDSLEKDKLMLSFTSGDLERLLESSGDGSRGYIYSFASFSSSDNMPRLHLLKLLQDEDAEPLEMKGDAFLEFVEVVKQECESDQKIGQLSLFLDERLRTIRPMLLERVQFGPLVSARYSREQKPDSMLGFLREYAPLDVAIHVKSEYVFSKKQVERKKNWLGLFDGGGKQFRQIPDIPAHDKECREDMASHISRSLILPHCVYQIVRTNPTFIAQYGAIEPIAYNKEGGLCVV